MNGTSLGLPFSAEGGVCTPSMRYAEGVYLFMFAYIYIKNLRAE